MNIYICSLLSKKNFKFLNSHLKSLNSRLKYQIIQTKDHICMQIQKIYFIRNFLKNFFR